MDCEKKYYDKYNNKKVYRYVIKTEDLVFEFLDFGARVFKIYEKAVPNSNIVLSFDTINDYLKSGTYAGATIGRVGGRINKGTFSLNGKKYNLDINDTPHHLHGGEYGMDKIVYETTIDSNENSVSLNFTTTLYEELDKYPGKIDVTVRHTIDKNNSWTIEYFACATEDTLFNPTNHVYFNLNQDFEQLIYNHELKLSASQFCQVDDHGLPTANILIHDNFNFKNKMALEKGFKYDVINNKMVGGYDHPFLLENDKKVELSVPSNDLSIEVFTDRDCVVIYTANELNYQSQSFQYRPHCAVALEFQQIPDAINNQLSNIILKKGEPFYSKTLYTIKRRT